MCVRARMIEGRSVSAMPAVEAPAIPRVVPVDPLDVPAVRLEARCASSEEASEVFPRWYPVVVVEIDDVAEAQVPGQGRRLVRDPSMMSPSLTIPKILWPKTVSRAG